MMKKFTNILLSTLFVLAGLTPVWAQVPSYPPGAPAASSTSLSWFRAAATPTDCSAPQFSITGDTDTGIGYLAANALAACAGGAVQVRFDNNYGVIIDASRELAWGSSGTSSPDLRWVRDAAGVAALKNGTTAQGFRVYRTTSSNHRVEIQGDEGSGKGRVMTNWSGGGGFNLILGAGTSHWEITTAGHLLAVTDNSWDIGASGATRPRNIYVGSGIFTPSVTVSGTVGLAGTSATQLLVGTDGIAQFRNNAGTDFTRLILGPNSTSGAALKKNGTGIDFVDGNDSNFASIRALSATVTTGGSFSGTDPSGTVLSNGSQAVANDAVISLGSNAAFGELVVTVDTDNSVCKFILSGTSNTVVETSDPAGICDTTSGTASRVNVYYSSGYKLENKRGGSRNIRLIRLGI